MITKVSIQKQIKKAFPDSNVYAVPRLVKIVVHTGIGRQDKGKDFQKTAEMIMAAATGQKPLPTKAKASISNFKIRRGMVIGLKVTLRKQKMYDFLTRLIRIALPRTRDFRGIDPNSIDDQGNLTIGIKDMAVFPEVPTQDLTQTIGTEVTLHTTAQNKEEALALFKILGIPFKTES